MNETKSYINWYPGHMTKAKRMMQENIKLIDLIIEVLDARIPLASKNPDIEELAKNKLRVVLLNKADLADERSNKLWKAYYEKQGAYVLELNAKSTGAAKAVHAVINEACKEKRERDLKRGIKNRPIRAMVVGIPNVGKSTFINSLAGKAAAKTGNKPGVTKGKQWIHISNSLELLDTPGILWPKFEDAIIGRNLAFIGSMNDEVIEIEELAYDLLQVLIQSPYKDRVTERYELDLESDTHLLYQIAENRKCYLKGENLDITKASKLFLDDYRSGRLGRITIENPVLEG